MTRVTLKQIKETKRLCPPSNKKDPNQRPSRGPSTASRLGALPGTASRYIIAALYEATNKLRNKTVKDVAKDARSVKIEKK